MEQNTLRQADAQIEVTGIISEIRKSKRRKQ